MKHKDNLVWRTVFLLRTGLNEDDFIKQGRPKIYNNKLDILNGQKVTFGDITYYVKGVDWDFNDNVIYVEAYTIKN